MRIIFSIFALLMLSAQLAVGQQPELRSPPEPRLTRHDPQQTYVSQDAPQAHTVLEAAIRDLDNHQSIAAKLRQEIDLFGHKLLGTGAYVQEGRGVSRRMRWEIKIAADRESSLQQICDGQHLWIHQQLLGQNTLKRIDVTRVRLAIDERRAEEAPAPSGFPLGGLPRLLESLQTSFDFAPVSESMLDGKLPVYMIEGHWKPARLAALTGAKGQEAKSLDVMLSKLPEQVPDHVRLFLGIDDRFPYSIEFMRTTAADPKKPTETTEKLLVLMEFTEVQFDATIDTRQFDIYKRGEPKFEDDTDAYLKSLGMNETRKKP